MSKELEQWNKVKKVMNDKPIQIGRHYSYMIRNDPKKLLFTLSRYKFAAKMIGEGKIVLEVGCSEGIGTNILAEKAKRVIAEEFDTEAIGIAIDNFELNEKIKFFCMDFLKEHIPSPIFDAFVAIDVIEHIYSENQKRFFDYASGHLKNNGICIIGTPNKEASRFASKTSQIGHINLFTWDRLEKTMKQYFEHVLMFSMNDEVVHTGFLPMAHYLIGVGINRKI